MPLPPIARWFRQRVVLVGLGLLLVVGVAALGLRERPDPQQAAGAMTVANRTSASFEQPAGGLTATELAHHDAADLVFDRSHVPLIGHAGSGLGPQFVAPSCVACHVRNGRGRAITDEALVRVVEAAGFGPQIQDKAVLGAEPEASVMLQWRPVRRGAIRLRAPDVAVISPDGEPLSASMSRSLRVAPPLLGLGLLEAVPKSTITALADPDDANGDGISGRVHWLSDADGQRRLGRFGWKAISASVRDQSADAYQQDMGLTTPASPSNNLDSAGQPADISNQELDLVTYYSQTLGAPRTAMPASSAVVRNGQRLFEDLNCAACHVPALQTGSKSDVVVQAIRDQTIWPYTDLLLHDMGPGLNDGVAEQGALSGEWRTAPLWGLGLTQKINPQATFLHDGRARSVEEAILWHGGEAEASRQAFLALAKPQRQALLRWLQQL
jgi:CxxC motif-containing protein (DUF1111 family)